ncbi:MAG: hypothetical protein AAF609_19605 [Cyanobacteria bacterium P01_C01_bin.120]
MSRKASATTTLTCLPKGLCSWDYTITGARPRAKVRTELWALRERGIIRVRGDRYDIIHAAFGGEWSLELDGNVVAIAVKPNPLTWFFEVSWHDQTLILKTDSLFGESFAIEQDDTLVGTIRKKHPFTKRATIDCSSSIDLAVQVFLFWLAALMWKRQVTRNGASAS